MGDAKSDNADLTKQSSTPEKLFELLFTELKGIFDGYKNYVFTTTATQVVAIGWFISSDYGAKFITRVHSFSSIFYGVIIFCILVEAWVSYYLFKRSKAIAKL